MRVKGIKRAKAKGRVYYYHRATGKRITAEIGTTEFALEVAALNKSVQVDKTRPNTLGSLITAYKLSPEYQRLAPRTKIDYTRILDYISALKDMPISQVNTPFILGVRDKAFDAHKRRFANYVLQLMGTLFAWGLPRGMVKDNPARGVPIITRPRDVPKGNRPWTPQEFDTFMDGAPKSLRIAASLGRYIGMRRGDVIKSLRASYDGSSIQWRQSKTGEDIFLPVTGKLKVELDNGPKNSLYLVCREDGRPYTPFGFKTVFFRRVKQLQDKGMLGKGLTFHGLRHTAAKHLAEAGCDTRDIAAVLGHKTEDMARRYADGENKRERAKAALLKLEIKKGT